MPPIAPSSRPYVSRRKRRLFATDFALTNRSVFALIGLLVVALVVSLGVIATQLFGNEPTALANTSAPPVITQTQVNQ
ncbi:hypothetical protein J0X19_17470 [Hymenobacter sp. BT186]|uniref:Uncharacterized protein n=1 Tax=Hymenobacter telluris TaxID=2816474 RepID=A0A939JDU1_9BACT|nr:hypothetical protein [Hymenobacter telluris]MBO0359755.1 hypothetical protein [Hymenobacter telluris]MBW3375782.1 hypothetical protein [Hymenobacter norwichensis]